MKLLILLLALCVACASAGRCKSRSDRKSEMAMTVAGMGYKNGSYFRLMGGIAGSRKEQKVVAYFKITCKKGSIKKLVHFDFANKVGYLAYGKSKADFRCVRIPISKAKALKCLVPRRWPNSRVVARTTLTGQRVPVRVYSGRYNKGNVSVKIGGIFDRYGVPVLIKKKYCRNGVRSGGALLFSGLRRPRAKYFALPSICRNATSSSSPRQQRDADNAVPQPL